MAHTGFPDNAAGDSGIIIRDRRKPNQYTTDNTIAREWLPILRVGDAFFFYSVYLSMANRETESSWGSLRTLAQYLQCGVDLIIRGNRLLEICELIYVETGNQYTSNEYYILDPPSLTPELVTRINHRLDDIETQETGKNWQAWIKQIRQALERHLSLPQIWAQRRANRGGRPIKTTRPENPGCEPHAAFSEAPASEPQSGCACNTTTLVVSHNQGAREPQPEQAEKTNKPNKVDQETDSLAVQEVVKKCQVLGIASTVLEILIEKHPLLVLQEQLLWLPARHPRDPAALFVRAVQENWSIPMRYDLAQAQSIWEQWIAKASSTQPVDPDLARAGEANAAAFAVLWQQVLQELEMQMTRATFDRWLRGTRVLRLEEKRMVVAVLDPYALEWLERRLAQTIQRTVQDVIGRPIAISFEVG